MLRLVVSRLPGSKTVLCFGCRMEYGSSMFGLRRGMFGESASGCGRADSHLARTASNVDMTTASTTDLAIVKSRLVKALLKREVVTWTKFEVKR